jgi:excisionase family DNA binding protein
MDQMALALDQAAHAAAVSKRTLEREVAAGRLVAVKRGRRTLVLAGDLREWLESLPRVRPEAA